MVHKEASSCLMLRQERCSRPLSSWKNSTKCVIKITFVMMDFEIYGWRAACLVTRVETKRRKGKGNVPYLFIPLHKYKYCSITPTPACGGGQDQRLENLSNSSGLLFAMFMLVLGNLLKNWDSSNFFFFSFHILDLNRFFPWVPWPIYKINQQIKSCQNTEKGTRHLTQPCLSMTVLPLWPLDQALKSPRFPGYGIRILDGEGCDCQGYNGQSTTEWNCSAVHVQQGWCSSFFNPHSTFSHKNQEK